MPNYELVDYPQRIEKSILIDASTPLVWDYLTNPDLMQKWMGDPEMKIEIISDWKAGSSFVIKAFHHEQFENRGKIGQFEPERVFQYEYRSSLSGLEDVPESYTTISFRLASKGEQTELRVEVMHFPTEIIYKHLEFYWSGTVILLKQLIEKN